MSTAAIEFSVQSCVIYAFSLRYENLSLCNKPRKYCGQILRKTRIRKTDVLSHFHRNVYWKLFTKLVNLFASWARPNINILDPLVIEVWKYRQHRRVGSFFTRVLQLQYSYENYNWNLFKNRSKWVSAEACQDIFHSF